MKYFVPDWYSGKGGKKCEISVRKCCPIFLPKHWIFRFSAASMRAGRISQILLHWLSISGLCKVLLYFVLILGLRQDEESLSWRGHSQGREEKNPRSGLLTGCLVMACHFSSCYAWQNMAMPDATEAGGGSPSVGGRLQGMRQRERTGNILDKWCHFCTG